jgi:hypothetical protein
VSTAWMKAGRVLRDAQGRVLMCGGCPCVVGTGTVPLPGTGTRCVSEICCPACMPRTICLIPYNCPYAGIDIFSRTPLDGYRGPTITGHYDANAATDYPGHSLEGGAWVFKKFGTTCDYYFFLECRIEDSGMWRLTWACNVSPGGPLQISYDTRRAEICGPPDDPTFWLLAPRLGPLANGLNGDCSSCYDSGLGGPGCTVLILPCGEDDAVGTGTGTSPPRCGGWPDSALAGACSSGECCGGTPVADLLYFHLHGPGGGCGCLGDAYTVAGYYDRLYKRWRVPLGGCSVPMEVMLRCSTQGWTAELWCVSQGLVVSTVTEADGDIHVFDCSPGVFHMSINQLLVPSVAGDCGDCFSGDVPLSFDVTDV